MSAAIPLPASSTTESWTCHAGSSAAVRAVSGCRAGWGTWRGNTFGFAKTNSAAAGGLFVGGHCSRWAGWVTN
jgi:hypothetical protein